MKDITYYNKRCAELIGKYVKDTPLQAAHYVVHIGNETRICYVSIPTNNFANSFDWQIPVWQKIVNVVVNKEASSTSQISKWEYIRDMYIQKIHFGTPETAFTILCQAIDFIDANGGEEGK